MNMQLSQSALTKTSIPGPGFSRQSTEVGIVHLGLGAFHRAHQAVYTNDAMAKAGGNWAISGISFRSSRVRDALREQDYLYTLVTHGAQKAYRIIGAVAECLVLGDEYEAVLARMADPRTRIITLTVTENGYCLNNEGELDLNDESIREDLSGDTQPATAIGLIATSLNERFSRGLPAPVIISCDNLSSNGAALRKAVICYSRHIDSRLAKWIQDEVQFPCSMVDSITPASDEALRDEVLEDTGMVDNWPIKREEFSQWVVEHFDGPRPSWEEVGVQFTSSVTPFEEAKLRLLNAPHSGLAYLGLLAGYRTVFEAFSDSVFREFFVAMTDREIIPTLSVPETTAGKVDLRRYRNEIFERFTIPSIEHLLSQIAWDGSKKLPQRVFGAVKRNLASGVSIDGLALIVAAWRNFCSQSVEQRMDIVDPLADRFRSSTWISDGTPRNVVRGLLAFDAMVPTDLAGNERFASALIKAETELADRHRAAIHAAMKSYVRAGRRCIS